MGIYHVFAKPNEITSRSISMAMVEFFSSGYMYIRIYNIIYMTEGSLEVKLPTIWTDEKQSRAEAERREKIRREKSRRKSQKKEDADA